ncbi:hypothetical protein EX30DRAFT_333126 [Ascodesmis nigricans]|uniref:Small subunit of serine palmitoyltransferase-like protein n=1 Tax=Ascodesmis nigricans TaxID=341454 RepID=A0A4V3SID2_9PEZI|nr:hypothetical protein EX30DRAFT_333126 [Ascodesmis nigricans]
MASALIKYLRLKRYQYEVTFSLYMLTPTEKIVFNTILFLSLSMLILAVSLYLPHHIGEVASKAWFYYSGDEALVQQQQVMGAAAAAAAGRVEL